MRCIALLALIALAACGGGGGGATTPPAVAAPSASPGTSAPKTGNVTFAITVPKRGVSATKRTAQAIPSGATRFDVSLTGSATLSASFTLSSDCTVPTPGQYLCATSILPGDYTVTGKMYDSNGALLATSQNVTPAASLAVRAGTNSVTLTMQGVVEQVYLQTPLMCAQPATLNAANGIPIRFLDADGQEIQGTFAFPVTMTSSNISAVHVAPAAGGNVDGTAITGDANVTSTAYPVTPGYKLSGDGSTEGSVSMAIASTGPAPIKYSFGSNPDIGTAPFAFASAHHLLLHFNIGSSMDLVAVPSMQTCQTAINTSMTNVVDAVADGTNDVIAATGENSGNQAVLFETQLQPTTNFVSLSGAFPVDNLSTTETTLGGGSAGVEAVARSAATNRVYVSSTVSRTVTVVGDAGFALSQLSSYSTGAPAGAIVTAPKALAVVNSPVNGDVLFIPDANGGNVSIVTHADTPMSAVGSNYDIHVVTPDGPDPLPAYSAVGYSNGATRIIAFELYDNGSPQLHTFNANFASTPTFNRSSRGSLNPQPHQITMGNGDSEVYDNDGTGGICYSAVGDPIAFPYSCDSTRHPATIASAGDNTYLAALSGTTTTILAMPASGSSMAAVATGTQPNGAISAFYTR